MTRRFARYGLLLLAATAIAAASTVVAAVSSALASPKPAQPTREAPEGVYEAPLDGPVTVTRPFEPPSDRYSSGHRGVDLAGAPGQLVRSAGGGEVVFAGYVGGRPLVSVLHPGGLRTTYEPVVPTVVKGQALLAGTQLGTLLPGHAECPAAACLHWGLRTGQDVYLDPLTLLRRSRVRLFPMSGPSAFAEAGSGPESVTFVRPGR